MEFSGGIQFGGGMQLTAPTTVTYTWLLSENATSNWGTNNKILVNTVQWGRNIRFADGSKTANNQISFNLPWFSTDDSFANAYLTKSDGYYFGVPVLSNAEVNLFINALTTGTEIDFYNFSKAFAETITLTDNARVVDAYGGGKVVVANVNMNMKDGINDGPGEIVNSSDGNWFMYGAANIKFTTDILSILSNRPRSPVALIPPVLSGSANVGLLLACTTGTWEGTLPITYTYQWRSYTGTYTNIPSATDSTYVLVDGDLNKAISCAVTATNATGNTTVYSNSTPDVAVRAQGYPWIVSESAEDVIWANYNSIISFDVSWGRRRIFNSTGAPRSDMSANNQVIINLPMYSVAGGTATAYLDGNDGDWFGGKAFSNAEVNVFVSAMTTGTEIVLYNSGENKAATLTLIDNARIVERSPIANQQGRRMIVANVNASFKDGISDNANEIVFGGANASIGEWFMYSSANVVLYSNILLTL